MTPPHELSGKLGRYRIVRKLGAGGMGTVYLAEDTRLPRKVALKVPHASTSDTVLERFRREAALASGVEHPNLCPVHDLEEIDGVLFFIMPYIEGTPLSQMIERGKPWPAANAVNLVRTIGAAVAHLHARGIIHRDLKPGNVMIRPSGEPVLMDFGLARDFTSQDARLTSPGTGMGSPSYMAPEQVAGRSDMGPAVDIYALGVILFELLTGRLPFEDPPPAIYVQILHTPAPAASSLLPGLDPQLDSVCLKALSKDPEARQQSVEELLHGLAVTLNVLAPPHPTHRNSPIETTFSKTTNPSQTDPVVTGPESISSAPTVRQSGVSEAPRSVPHRWSTLLLALVPLALVVVVGGWFLFGRKKNSLENGNPSGLEPARAKAPFEAAAAKRLQQGWADWLNRKVVEEVDLGDGMTLPLVLIPPGRFRMGSAQAEKRFVRQHFGAVAGDWADEEVQHEVEMTRPFYLSKFEITQEEYLKLTGKESGEFRANGKQKDKVIGLDTKRFPVENVSWEEAVRFCEILSRKVGRKVELPSEAQWEYACRAGTETAYHFGDTLNGTEANCNGTVPYMTDIKGNRLERPCEVGSFAANAWGLQDMHGNLFEWCRDSHGPYAGLESTDPARDSPARERTSRILRGGCWSSPAHECRAAARNRGDFEFRSYGIGFRIAVRVD
jgi:serine/threonine protein kinase/formylglycine-generating enzyme required for sulfatase activity